MTMSLGTAYVNKILCSVFSIFLLVPRHQALFILTNTRYNGSGGDLNLTGCY